MRHDRYTNWGPLVVEFSRRLAMQLGAPPEGVVTASSGTAALTGAILATAGRARKDRPLAVLPAFTFVATAFAAEQCGFTPWLADVDADTWLLNPERALDGVRAEQVGLVVPVASFGRPVPQAPWQRFRDLTGISVVIDGAASVEAVASAPALFVGDIPLAISFHATKALPAGEGGCVATTDTGTARRVLRALNFGFFGTRDAASAGTNGKLSEYHAAVGLAALDTWPEIQAKWLDVSRRYTDALAASVAGRFIGAPDVAGCYALWLCSEERQSSRLMDCLREDGVEFRMWYGMGVHSHSYFASVHRGPLPVTEDLAPRLIGLPVAVDLSAAELGGVVAAIERAAKDPRQANSSERYAGK